MILAAYFDAKAIQYQGTEGFELRDAGPLKCLHGVPGWPEVDAFYAWGVDPEEAITAIQTANAHERHALTIFNESSAPNLDTYARLGYVKIPGQPQPLMHLALESPRGYERKEPVVDLDCRIVGRRRHGDERIADYEMMADGKVVCRGSSIRACDNTLYVFGVGTEPDYRRRGLASALMAQMHRDAIDCGCTSAFLCASPDGAKLYDRLGYTTVLYMHMLVPAADGLF